ncbi:hypothetical protein FAI41_03750 [Acetobacteraceae bacterium]|nr:hypothetical protein FAI41_03750 [Acetobacteraceae bacterium]
MIYQKSSFFTLCLFSVFYVIHPNLSFSMPSSDSDIVHEEAQEQARYYQDQQRINQLERQNLELKSENQKLKTLTPPNPPSLKEQATAAHKAEKEALARQNENIQNFCRRLLWACQLPDAPHKNCQRFTDNCAGLEKTIGEMKISVPIDLPLGETEKFHPVGYLTPTGVVKGVHHHILGYTVPGDIDSALMMAATANLQDYDTLPENFPLTSPAHPYRITPQKKKMLRTEIMPHRNECGLMIDQCVTLSSESAECFAHYNRTCGRHVPYVEILKNLRQQSACANYRINNNLEPLKRLQMLRDCGRDPTQDPEKESSYMAVTDCHSLNLLCQVKQNKMPYCQAFSEGECLSGKKNKIKKSLPHRMPFWEAPDPTALRMAHPITQWPDCSVPGNIILETPHNVQNYLLGRITNKGALSLYTEGEILRDAAQIDAKGHLVTLSQDPTHRALLKHFQRIERIAADGTLWKCHRENNAEKIKRFLTPQGALFNVMSDWSGNLHYEAQFGFKAADMASMRQETSALPLSP